jgi:hypothetical protein
LKNLNSPIRGSVNGNWQLQSPDGTIRSLDRENPFRQALEGKYAVSDEMDGYARHHPNIGNRQKYYKQIESSWLQSSIGCCFTTTTFLSDVYVSGGDN